MLNSPDFVKTFGLIFFTYGILFLYFLSLFRTHLFRDMAALFVVFAPCVWLMSIFTLYKCMQAKCTEFIQLSHGPFPTFFFSKSLFMRQYLVLSTIDCTRNCRFNHLHCHSIFLQFLLLRIVLDYFPIKLLLGYSQFKI